MVLWDSQTLHACRLPVNLSNHHAPFGGLGGSGVGHYFGKLSFDAFTHPFMTAYRSIGKLWDLNSIRYHLYMMVISIS